MIIHALFTFQHMSIYPPDKYSYNTYNNINNSIDRIFDYMDDNGYFETNINTFSKKFDQLSDDIIKKYNQIDSANNFFYNDGIYVFDTNDKCDMLDSCTCEYYEQLNQIASQMRNEFHEKEKDDESYIIIKSLCSFIKGEPVVIIRPN